MSLLSFKNTLNATALLNFSTWHKCIDLLNLYSYESGQQDGRVLGSHSADWRSNPVINVSFGLWPKGWVKDFGTFFNCYIRNAPRVRGTFSGASGYYQTYVHSLP